MDDPLSVHRSYRVYDNMDRRKDERDGEMADSIASITFHNFIIFVDTVL